MAVSRLEICGLRNDRRNIAAFGLSTRLILGGRQFPAGSRWRGGLILHCAHFACCARGRRKVGRKGNDARSRLQGF